MKQSSMIPVFNKKLYDLDKSSKKESDAFTIKSFDILSSLEALFIFTFNKIFLTSSTVISLSRSSSIISWGAYWKSFESCDGLSMF